MHAAGSATVLREDGPAILPVEEEREEIDMGKITITEKQEAIIRRLNDPLYTVEFLKEWVNRNDNVFINAPAALQEHSTNPGGMQRARLDLPGL